MYIKIECIYLKKKSIEFLNLEKSQMTVLSTSLILNRKKKNVIDINAGKFLFRTFYRIKYNNIFYFL